MPGLYQGKVRRFGEINSEEHAIAVETLSGSNILEDSSL